MFSFRRPRSKDLAVREIMDVMGYVLQHRPNIINYGDVAKENVLVGVIIGKAFADDRQRLDDEFNALAVFLTYRAYNACGVPKEKLDQALRKLFDEFMADGVFVDLAERNSVYDHMTGRVSDYLSVDNLALARRVADNIAVREPYSQNQDASKLLARQLKDYERSVLKFISDNIKVTP